VKACVTAELNSRVAKESQVRQEFLAKQASAREAQDAAALAALTHQKTMRFLNCPWAAHGHSNIEVFDSVDEFVDLKRKDRFAKPAIIKAEAVKLCPIAAATMQGWQASFLAKCMADKKSCVTATLSPPHGLAEAKALWNKLTAAKVILTEDPKTCPSSFLEGCKDHNLYGIAGRSLHESRETDFFGKAYVQLVGTMTVFTIDSTSLTKGIASTLPPERKDTPLTYKHFSEWMLSLQEESWSEGGGAKMEQLKKDGFTVSIGKLEVGQVCIIPPGYFTVLTSTATGDGAGECAGIMKNFIDDSRASAKSMEALKTVVNHQGTLDMLTRMLDFCSVAHM